MGESVRATTNSNPGKQERKTPAKVQNPGSKHIDSKLVCRAVHELNAIYAAKALETACLIGEYVLDRFFDGDIDTFAGNCGKQTSFRALARHKDLRFSATYLWTAVAVVGQVRELPADVAHRLPLSHHRLLLPLKDTATKTRLATLAVKSGLSKRDLARQIGRLDGHRGFARSQPTTANGSLLKSLSHLVEASEDFVLEASSVGDRLARSGGQGTEALLRRLEVDLDAVHCVVAMLRARSTHRAKHLRGVSPGKQLIRPRNQIEN